MKFWRRASAIAVGLLVLCARSAFATTNQAVSVSGNVIADCTTTTMPLTGSLALGTYNPFSSTDLKPAPFSFSTNCTIGDTNLNVAVDGGANYANAAPSGDRALKDGTGHYLTYQLYTDSTYGTPWPFSASGGAGTAINLTAGGINTANTISLYGVIPHGQTNTDAGSYSDTVHVTVNY